MKRITVSFTDTAEDDAAELPDEQLAWRALDSLTQIVLTKVNALDYIEWKIEEVE